MKKRKRYTWFFVLVILLVFYISFFYMERTEISDIDLLLVVGIDKTEDGYHVTGMYNKDGGVDDATAGTHLIDGYGASFYEAYEDLMQKNLKNVSIAHTSYYIFAEGAAKNGLSQCLDYIERDQTVKMDALVYILKDMSVNEFMKKSIDAGTQLVTELRAINEKQLDQMTAVDNTLSKIGDKLGKDYLNQFIPYLVQDKDYIYINGYSVIKNDSLVAFLDREQSTTLDFVRNRLRTLPIYLNSQVGLEITESHVAREVKLVNGELVVDLDITFESDIKEVTSDDYVYEKYYVQQLVYEQNEYIAQRVQALLDAAKEYQIDVVDAANIIRTIYMKDWDTILARWNRYFSNISYQYNIKSQTAQSYVVAT